MPKKRRKTKRPAKPRRVVQPKATAVHLPQAALEEIAPAFDAAASPPHSAGSHPAGSRRSGLRAAAPVLALAAFIAVAYFPAMAWGGFVWDDRIFTESLEVRTWQGLWNMWFNPNTMTEVHYWPLVYTTFWLEHKLWGFDPTGYHIVNVVLHFLNSWLLLRILSRLKVRTAWLAAAVFAVHPVHVDSVAWVIERKDVLSGLMYLGAVLAWLRFDAEPRARHYLAALGLLVLGMLSKSVVVTLPVALGIVQWWRHGRLTKTDLKCLAPLFVVAVGIALADLAYLRSRSVTEYDYTFIERLLIAAHATWLYFAKIVWPASLAVIYPFWEVAATRWVEWLYVLGIVALLAALWWLRDRITRGPLAGALFFGVTLFPTLGFFDHYYITYSFVADRFQYLASIGPIVVLTGVGMAAANKVMLRVLPRSKANAKIVVGVMLGVLAMLVVLTAITWRQSSIYESPITFFGHIVSLNPEANGAYTGLSAALYVDGLVEESYEAAKSAIAVNDQDVRAHLNISFPLRDMGRLEEAEAYMRRALELGPDALQGLEIYLALGSLLQDQGRDEEALEVARAAVRYGPRSLTANVNLGSILIKVSRYEEAEQHLRRARQIEPNDPNLLHNLAEALRLQGRLEEALEAYQGVLALNPDNAALAYAAMGDILFRLERYDEAIVVLQRTVELEPNASFVPAMYVYMGRSAEALGRLDAAEQYYRNALAANPAHAEASALLARLRQAGTAGESEDAP